jgi:tetratricopeptide (TPR) repeat protein
MTPQDIGQSLNLALAEQRQGRLREAEKIYARVLKAEPRNFDALNLLGAVKLQQGQAGEAQRLFSAAVKANPGVPHGWSHLGQALYALKRAPEALECLDKARALAPDNTDILYQHANLLLSLGRSAEALTEFQAVLTRAPRHVEAHINSGLAQAALGSPEAALGSFDEALALAPGHPVAQFNRGVALLKLGRYAEALAVNDAALAAAPEHLGALLNRGKALAQLNRLGEAVASYDRAIALKKDYADAHFNAAQALLTLGDYRRGFEEYEWRWRRTGMAAPKSRGRPLWRGEYPLVRKTILLHAEQGLGDTIQFARYVPLLAAMGATVVIEVQPELKSLMARLAGAATVIARDEAPPPFDLHCPLGSLPLALKTELATVPALIPYLAADEAQVAKWSQRLGELPRPRIALAWAGNPSHDNDRNRSIPFARLSPLLDALNPPPLAGEGRGPPAPPAAGGPRGGAPGPRASFISIQRDLRDEDATALAAESRVTHIGDALSDFSDTAAVLALCDHVITVDTAVAHLAGAMGRPVWVLVPFAPDWRWTLQGETTPWYPTARLFRQSATGEWDNVLASVAAELARLPSHA